MVLRMPKMIQIRNVPDDLHRRLKVRAAEVDMTLSDYLLAEVRAVADRPTLAELSARISAQERVDADADWIVQVVREQRDER